MEKVNALRCLKLIIVFVLAVAIVTACVSSSDGDIQVDLKGTISAQSTWIAYVSTQVSKQEQTNLSQWESISRLYTQMPYALGFITPIPPGMTITRTPTPHPITEQDDRPTNTPTPAMSIDIEYPPDTRTGINEIDKVIETIMGDDIDARLELIHLISTPCTTGDGLGGPPKCEPGESDGTIVEVFPVSSGEGHHVRPNQIRNVFNFTVRGVVAVYVVPEDVHHPEYWPAGTHGVIFSSEDGEHPHTITVLVDSGRIVRLDFSPIWPPFDLIRQKSDTFILPPIH